jgi:hypothetical protein
MNYSWTFLFLLDIFLITIRRSLPFDMNFRFGFLLSCSNILFRNFIEFYVLD